MQLLATYSPITLLVLLLAAPCEAQGNWPFRPPSTPAIPVVDDVDRWGQNPVDQFVLARLKASRLGPSSPADRETLIRRASITLTGLLPSTEQVTRFVSDLSPAAWPRLVDRLLASPQYGERWAQHWLDVVPLRRQ